MVIIIYFYLFFINRLNEIIETVEQNTINAEKKLIEKELMRKELSKLPKKKIGKYKCVVY